MVGKVHLNGVFEHILPVLEPLWPQRRVHESTMSDRESTRDEAD